MHSTGRRDGHFHFLPALYRNSLGLIALIAANDIRRAIRLLARYLRAI